MLNALLKALCYTETLLKLQLIKNTFLKTFSKKIKEKGRFKKKLKLSTDKSLSPEKDYFLLKGQKFKCQYLIILVNGILI